MFDIISPKIKRAQFTVMAIHKIYKSPFQPTCEKEKFKCFIDLN